MNSRKKIIIYPLIFLAAALIIISVLIYPLFFSIRKSSEKIIFLKEKINFSQKEIEEIQQAKGTSESINSVLEKLERVFINSEVPVDFIRFLEKTAGESSVEIDISSFSAGNKESDPWESLGFQLNLTGAFPDFLRFLNIIEKSPYLIEISNLNIQKAFQSEADNVIALLAVKVFAK